jgi:hypothetical protein
MTAFAILSIIIVYFGILFAVSHFTSKKRQVETVFLNQQNSKLVLVAFGMIGTALSVLTFISVRK